jgi:hypothetical protein
MRINQTTRRRRETFSNRLLFRLQFWKLLIRSSSGTLCYLERFLVFFLSLSRTVFFQTPCQPSSINYNILPFEPDRVVKGTVHGVTSRKITICLFHVDFELFHDWDYEEDCLLKCEAMESGRDLRNFLRKLLLQSSEYNIFPEDGGRNVYRNFDNVYQSTLTSQKIVICPFFPLNKNVLSIMHWRETYGRLDLWLGLYPPPPRRIRPA